MKELACLPAGTADVTDLLERPAIQDRDALVRTIRNVQKPLLRIRREPDAERGASSLRFALHESFLQECAVDRERLNPVVGAIRDIDDAVVGDGDAVRRVELL